MASLSQNSWRVRDRDELVWFTAAGARFAAANDDVAYLAAYVINQFDATVERIHGPVLDDWSWAVRPVRGKTTGYSNHASATAWDLNATKHPRGVHGTYSAAQKAAVHSILNRVVDAKGNRIFRWGEEYVAPSTVDGMHFEINASASQVASAAHLLRIQEADRIAREAAAAQALEDEVSFHDQHTLTQADIDAYGDPTLHVGDKKSYDELVRFPPAMARMRREQHARDVVIDGQIAALTKTVQTLAAALKTSAPKQ